MKRTPFKRPQIERRPAIVTPLARSVNVTTITPAALTMPKRAYVRSPALMRAYRTLACQHCGRDDGTVCGAHSNWAEHGKGRGIKADDNRAASLCFSCHSWLDQGTATAERKRVMWNRAHRRTVEALIALGRWPADADAE